AGPVGSLAALAHARRGARVLLLEANPNAASRFAGEWLHPAGVAVLDRLRAGRLEEAAPRTGYGFVVFPDDGSPPVELPYAGGAVALAAEHGAIVHALRTEAADTADIDYRPGARALAYEDGVLAVG